MIELKKKFDSYIENGYDYNQALKKYDLSVDSVVKLRGKLQKVQCVPKLIYNRHLILFLSCCKGDVDEAARQMEKYYNLKVTSPELFWSRDPESSALQFSFKIQQMAPLPITPDDCYLFIHRVSDADPKLYDFDDVFKMFVMMAENVIISKGPKKSIFISDWTGIRFGHLLRPSLSSIRKTFEFIQYASPVKMKAIHILNSSPLVQILFSMCKPFMRLDFFKIIHVHPTNLDFEEFFSQHIPRSCMPADYGGDLETVEELHAKNVENLIANKEYFYLEEHHFRQRFDEFCETCKIDSEF